MRKIISVTLLCLGVALGSIGLSGTSQATVSCVNLPGHIQQECVGTNGLYWTENLQTRQFYQHGTAPGQTVMEQFFCQNDARVVLGHTTCKANAPGVPPNTPGWERRVISLADGCTIYGWNVVYDNKTPPAPEYCTLPYGQHRHLTATEQRSVLAFWGAIQQVGGHW